MPINVIGLFSRREQAEAAVLDLEHAGIVGEQVEMISDPDRDPRAEDLVWNFRKLAATGLERWVR